MISWMIVLPLSLSQSILLLDYPSRGETPSTDRNATVNRQMHFREICILGYPYRLSTNMSTTTYCTSSIKCGWINTFRLCTRDSHTLRIRANDRMANDRTKLSWWSLVIAECNWMWQCRSRIPPKYRWVGNPSSPNVLDMHFGIDWLLSANFFCSASEFRGHCSCAFNWDTLQEIIDSTHYAPPSDRLALATPLS